MDSRASQDLCWAAEEACLAARPSGVEVVLGGWLLRAAGGPTRRVNSINPLRGWRDAPETVIAQAARLYGGLGRPLIVRVPGLAPEMAACCDQLGYSVAGEACTLWAGLTGHATPVGDGITLLPRPDAPWFAAWAACEGIGAGPVLDLYRDSLGRIVVPAAFARRQVGGEPAAVAYAAVHRGLLVFESVVTRPDRRRQGHAAAVIRALMSWGVGEGATGACLQVAAENAPARTLYHALGFTQELYRYDYRRPR